MALNLRANGITVDVYLPCGGYYGYVYGTPEMFTTTIIVDGVKCRKVGHPTQFHYVRAKA